MINKKPIYEQYEEAANLIKAKYALSNIKIEGARFVCIFRWSMFGGNGYVNYWHLAEPDEVRKVACEMMRALEWIIPGEYKISASSEL